MEEVLGVKRGIEDEIGENIQNGGIEANVNQENPKEEKTVNGEQPPSKKQKQNKPSKVRGLPEGLSRRAAKKLMKQERQNRTKAVAIGEECSFGANHDVEAFLATKEADIGPECYYFTQSGTCPFGLNCRFARAHCENNKSIAIPNFESKLLPEMNVLSKELQIDLRKKKIKFSRSAPLVRQWRAEKKKRILENNPHLQAEENDDVPTEAPTTLPTPPTENFASTPSVVPTEEVTLMDREIPLRPEEKKKFDVKDKLYLAPLTTVGNLPFRRICKRFGADITIGEMAMAANLLQGQSSEWALLKRHPSEDFFGVQIAGSHMDQMTQCAELLEEYTTVDFVDINMGCPIDVVTKRGAGSALLDNTRRIADMTINMNKVLSVPLTIKVRTGKDEKNPTVHKIFPKLKDWGVAAITLHGRSRQQRYTGSADWEYIAKCVSLSPVPVIGNGDIYNPIEYLQNVNASKVSTVMIARGALIKPWLFTELKERKLWDISAQERLDFARDYINYGLEHWGSDTEGVERTRKFFLEWHSFLYRYIPIGIVETLPGATLTPKMTDKPIRIEGRTDLETLLGSPDVKDWIKISEMFLGPAPSNFIFNPKHKANAYDSNNG